MISQTQYQDFLKAVTDLIEGEWVLVGGALIAVLIKEARATADIDLCPIGELTNERRLQLMRLAQSSGLSAEAINSSADFFLRQIPQWQSSLVVFIKGNKGTLYRPSLELYIKMKCARLSENDILDCVAFLKWHREENISFDEKIIVQYLENKRSSETSPIKIKSLNLLISEMTT